MKKEDTQCKICCSDIQCIFSDVVLGKYNVNYYQCEQCGFIQTESPFWLEESYASAITSLDLGYTSRNLLCRDISAELIQGCFNPEGKFLDYGGGYGLFVRLMRDAGYDFYRGDLYCDNLFANCFDLSDLDEKIDFELVTCFEVLEHLDNPISEMEKILTHSNSILFSTELQPSQPLHTAGDWEYLAPDTGQHIAFYTEKALSVMARKFGLNFYTDGKNIHLFTNKKLHPDCISKSLRNIRSYYKMFYLLIDKSLPFIRGRKLRKTLLQSDYQLVKQKNQKK